MLDGRFADDPFLRGLLGYRWGAADSVREWRERHGAGAAAERAEA